MTTQTLNKLIFVLLLLMLAGDMILHLLNFGGVK